MAHMRRIRLIGIVCFLLAALRIWTGESEAVAQGVGAVAAPPAAGALPPQGWWVPATLKMPRAAEGRLAWRFTLREIITVSKDSKLERHPADLVWVPPAGAGKLPSWRTTSSEAQKAEAQTSASPARPQTSLPPLAIEYDEKKGTLTLTFTGGKAAFFTLNPAGDEDAHRFDNLVIDKHADAAQVRYVCDKAAKCCRVTLQSPECAPTNETRTLTHCNEVLSRVRQSLAAEHRAIPPACR